MGGASKIPYIFGLIPCKALIVCKKTLKIHKIANFCLLPRHNAERQNTENRKSHKENCL